MTFSDEGASRRNWRYEDPFESICQTYKIETLQVESNIQGESEGKN
jgi:hypothetical protein